MSSQRPVSAARLERFAAAVLRASDVPAPDAELVADSLVCADLWGHQSHGVLRLPWYVERLRSGAMRPVTRVELVVDSGAVAVLDGHDGVGQVVAAAATREAIRRAKSHGVAAVAVRNSNHLGCAAYFTRMAPPQGCIAVLASNASPAMAPWGGRVKRVGTNPWSIAAPAGRDGTAVIDIANSAVARGKIHLARQRGERIPEGWALDAEGEPTTDPERALSGVALPMGGHKGYAIAFMMDVLAGVLSGGAFGSQVAGPYQAERPGRNGHLLVTLDVAAFLEPAAFEERMEQLIAEVKAVPAADGADPVRVPGEPEERSAARGRVEGLALPERTLSELRRLARETGVEPALWPEEGR